MSATSQPVRLEATPAGFRKVGLVVFAALAQNSCLCTLRPAKSLSIYAVNTIHRAEIKTEDVDNPWDKKRGR